MIFDVEPWRYNVPTRRSTFLTTISHACWKKKKHKKKKTHQGCYPAHTSSKYHHSSSGFIYMLLTKDINLTVNLKEKLDPAPCGKKEPIKNSLRNIISTSEKYTPKQKWHMRENKIKNKLKLLFLPPLKIAEMRISKLRLIGFISLSEAPISISGVRSTEHRLWTGASLTGRWRSSRKHVYLIFYLSFPESKVWTHTHFSIFGYIRQCIGILIYDTGGWSYKVEVVA